MSGFTEEIFDVCRSILDGHINTEERRSVSRSRHTTKEDKKQQGKLIVRRGHLSASRTPVQNMAAYPRFKKNSELDLELFLELH
jgi:hypothetical protein